ncbi:MAG: (S)-ureidoglycine aminohydrolase [Rhodospirillales bacterium]|nr:(S)-ureidoglycine aminohydrolase [Rhodospirillales bacterium]MDE2199356.1 (S)-ureidoglycine aminohydrolase [Rhodospirillales bacterium]MDE2574054.1 (S)-ureidoglycine aminohydrolase [Rhodospirillales bacterium]
MPHANPPPGIFGHNRTMVTPHYAVMPPEGILESRLAYLRDTLVRFHTSPAMGARFAQALLEMAPAGGTTQPIADGLEHFLYIVSGTLEIGIGAERAALGAGGFAYAPAGAALDMRARDSVRAIWIKRPYEAISGHRSPAPIFGHRDQVAPRRKHTEGRIWQHLLPDEDFAFDMAVNILSFAPGTHFPFVETHIMEHGLYMLQGQGLYLLGRDWHECWTGDFIWMGSYVPQQFYCTGWQDAAYLLYKDINRDIAFAR